MAKKIRLDFSKTEERSGWNTRHIPEGLHKMKVAGVQVTEAGDGTPMLVYSLVPTDDKYKSRNFPFYCKLQENQLWKLRDLLVAAGIKVPKKAQMVDPDGPVGKLIAAEVQDDEYKDVIRSQVQATYGLDILDDDGAADDSDEDSEEEYEDEEYDADDEEDDDGDDDEDADEEEDELREELEGLGLPALRKRAKELGITTTGLKKDELVEAILEEELAEEDDEDEDDLDEEDLDDEDLDDEDLEDDEDEDEEEEPEPAPRRRRPAAKPAAKAPAKAAPKASARRTVKRR